MHVRRRASRTSIVMLQMERVLIRLNVIMKSIAGRRWAFISRALPFSRRRMRRLRKSIGMETGSAEHIRRLIIHSHRLHRPLNIRHSSMDRASSATRSSIMFHRPRVHIQRVTRQTAIRQVRDGNLICHDFLNVLLGTEGSFIVVEGEKTGPRLS